LAADSIKSIFIVFVTILVVALTSSDRSEFISEAGAAASAYTAASLLITLLLWISYSAQILLSGAEFTQVYSDRYGSPVEPAEYAGRVKRREVEQQALRRILGGITTALDLFRKRGTQQPNNCFP
jgi:uncharacterized BrkB/YihY/UPF0761 family membrane protein